MAKAIKVLMVDDEEQFRTTTQKILQRRGFETILAGSGEEALEHLKDNPDVVVLDIKMPGMDGHQTLKAVKQRIPQVPVIMLTGHGGLPSAQEALSEGAFDYLTKPCDIDLLAAKIIDASRLGKIDEAEEEKKVRDVMIPIEDYTTLTEDHTIQEAVEKLKESFLSKISTSRIMETGHRSLFVFDHRDRITGVLAIADLLEAIMPAYLSAPKISTADSIQYSPMFWSGMFNREVRQLAAKKIKEVMCPTPPEIDADSNLMEAAYVMIQERERRLVVVSSGAVIGVIREQDLFFEIERVLRQ